MQIGREVSLDEELETTYACPPYSTNSTNMISSDGMVSVNDIDPNFHSPFETVDPNILHKGAGTFGEPNQPGNTFSPGKSSSASNTTLMGPGLSEILAQGWVQPTAQAHKYQCTTCQKTFDRASRLDNCYNGHSGLKPYSCFGSCGRLKWYATFDIPANLDLEFISADLHLHFQSSIVRII